MSFFKHWPCDVICEWLAVAKEDGTILIDLGGHLHDEGFFNVDVPKVHFPAGTKIIFFCPPHATTFTYIRTISTCAYSHVHYSFEDGSWFRLNFTYTDIAKGTMFTVTNATSHYYELRSIQGLFKLPPAIHDFVASDCTGLTVDSELTW